MTALRISVIIRAHNVGPFLEEAIASLDRQTRRPDEVVIVNDGSEDDTGDAIARIRGRGYDIQVVEQHPSRGPSSAFNAGVNRSRGDLIIALDGDDRLSERYLELAECAITSTGADLSYGGEQRFGAEQAYRPAPQWDPRELAIENFLHVSVLFRRWIFDQTRGFNKGFDTLGLEDWEFWIHAVEAGAVGVPVPGIWLEYRRHATGSRNSLRHRDVLAAHLLVRRLHPRTVTWLDTARWMQRSAARNLSTRRGAQ